MSFNELNMSAFMYMGLMNTKSYTKQLDLIIIPQWGHANF